MKTLYFDCSSGISGNMTLGALLEIIGDEKYLLKELKKLNVDGYKIEISKKVKNGITATYVDVILEHEHHHEEEHLHEHEHHLHHHEHRNLYDVNKIIEESSNVKFRQIEIDTELVTPTGAAIIAELATEFTTLPTMTTEKIGWGAGYKDLKIPNILKVYYGEMQEKSENFVVMETNMDDCNGEILGYCQEELLKNGALDVFYTPIFMKKNRPAYCLTVACKKEDMFKLQNIIFKETTTIGMRYRFEVRTELGREMIEIETKYGKLKAKKVINNGEVYVYPEYESMKEIAQKNDIPLKELYKLSELL